MVQSKNKKGSLLIILLIILAGVLVLAVVLFKSGKLNFSFNTPPGNETSSQKESRDQQLTNSDEVVDIQKDLDSTSLDETDKVLGEVDKALDAK